jgi:hypothetical protein
MVWDSAEFVWKSLILLLFLRGQISPAGFLLLNTVGKLVRHARETLLRCTTEIARARSAANPLRSQTPRLSRGLRPDPAARWGFESRASETKMEEAYDKLVNPCDLASLIR